MIFCAYNAIFLVISQMKAIVVKDAGLVLDFFVSSMALSCDVAMLRMREVMFV